jgi:4-amino-4-deoxy-L-arabinose transferase-like glycosyltransferase
LLWIIGRASWRLSGWEGAILGVAAFGLNLVTPRLTTLVRTDMVLALFIALAGFTIYEKLQAGTAWTTAERWKIFAMLLGSMLTKGPIVYAFLLPGMVAFGWLQRKRAEPTSVWSGWWSWVGPLIFFAGWAGIGLATNPEFFDQVVRREFMGRFTLGEKAVHNNQPVYFYLLHLLRDFFPWSIALIAMASIRDVRERVRRDPALLWLVCWGIGGFVFMSLVPSKRGDRIFPIYPPLCLLVPALAAMVPTHLIPKANAAARTWAVVLLAAATAGGYTIYRVVESYRFRDQALTEFCAQVRTASPSGRLAVVTGKDEGMLLYLGVLRFTKWEDAVELWRARAIDTLIVPERYETEIAGSLPGARVAHVSLPAREKFSRYICLTRSPE